MDFTKIKADYLTAKETERILSKSEANRIAVRNDEINNVYNQFRYYFKNKHNFVVANEPTRMLAKFEIIVVTLTHDN